MTQEATIPEVPKPPKRRLPFPLFMYRMIANPAASWSREFYEEPIVVYRNRWSEMAFVMDPELLQRVLLDDLDSFTRVYTRVFGRGGSEGLIMAEGEGWKWQRQVLAPLFRADEMASHIPTFVAASTPLLERWRKSPPGSLQNVYGDMAAITLQVLEDALLGAGLDDKEHRLIAAAVTDFVKPLTWKSAYNALKLPPSTPHPGRARRARASRDLRDIAARGIAARQRGEATGNDLLGRLVAARDPATGSAMPHTMIVDNVETFVIVGHETTANALTWTLYLLALFPEWQERAREEIRREAPDGTLGREQVERLELLDGIFQEAMRLFPPGAVIMRKAREAVTLGGKELSAGTTIIIPIYVVHRHRKLWEDPLRFDPTRFRPEARAKRHRFSYLPFGAGPRTCIGAAFAMVEGKTLLARLLANARFELPKGELPIPLVRLTLRPQHGLKLKVTML